MLQTFNITFEQVFIFILSKTTCFPPPPCYSLEKMMEALLLMLRETEVSDAIPSLLQVFQNVTANLVKVTQAENGRSKPDAAQFLHGF